MSGIEVATQDISCPDKPVLPVEICLSNPADLGLAVSKSTAERDELREANRISVRSFEQFHAYISSRIEAKEKELRYLLAPRSAAAEADGTPGAQPSIPVTSAKFSIPSVRPVPTLIGGSTKFTDSLLGPAHGPCFSVASSVNPPTFNRSESRVSVCDTVNSTGEPDDSVLYSKMPIDTSVNLVLSRLRRTQSSCNALVTSNQTDLQSFTFTQNSQNGKRIMMRVRVLEQENEELANANRKGRTAKLETEIALRRRFVQDLKQTYSDIEYLVEEVEGETELFGSSLLMLQQRLSMAKLTAQLLATELEILEPGRARAMFEGAMWSPFTDNVAIESMTVADSLSHNTIAENDQDAHQPQLTVPSSKFTCSSELPPGSPEKEFTEVSRTPHGDSKKNRRLHVKHGAKRSKASSRANPEEGSFESQSGDRNQAPSKVPRTNDPCYLSQHPINQIPTTRPSIPIKGPQRTFADSYNALDPFNQSSSDPYFPTSTNSDIANVASNPHPDKVSSSSVNPLRRQSMNNIFVANDRPSNGQLADDNSTAQ